MRRSAVFILCIMVMSLKVSALNQYNNFKLSDRSTKGSITCHPDLGVNIGLGLTRKSIALDLSTSLGIQQKDISSSTYRDIQIRLLTSRHHLRLRYQYDLGCNTSMHQLRQLLPESTLCDEREAAQKCRKRGQF